MKNKLPYIIFLATLGLAACGSNTTSNDALLATNEALSMQATIQAGIISTQAAVVNVNPTIEPTKEPASTNTPSPTDTQAFTATVTVTETAVPTEMPVISTETIESQLVASGSGTNTFQLTGYLPYYNIYFPDGVNSFMLDTAQINLMWEGFSSFGYTMPLAVGSHTMSINPASNSWEIWTVGTPPFGMMGSTISNNLFLVNQESDYLMYFAVTSGAYTVVVECGKVENNKAGNFTKVFEKQIVQSENYRMHLVPGICNLKVQFSDSGPHQWQLLFNLPL